jgi:hypothetical protein
MKTRLIHEVGTSASLRVYWGGGGVTDPANDVCPNAHGRGRAGYHNAKIPLARSEKLGDWDLGGKAADYPDDRWPSKCDHCGAPVPADLPISPPASSYTDDDRHVSVVHRQIHRERLYDTASGRPELGDIWEQPWYHEHFCQWSNCDGRHLVCLLPDGHEWQMTGRANNCTMRDDGTHRCWVVHEESPGVFHVDKGGHTCAAGAGSIATATWHGFLVHGELVSC